MKTTLTPSAVLTLLGAASFWAGWTAVRRLTEYGEAGWGR